MDSESSDGRLTRLELARELVEIFDELRTEQLNEVVAMNVPLDALEFFSAYAEEFCEGTATPSSVRKRLPNLMLLGYLLRLLEERLPGRTRALRRLSRARDPDGVRAAAGRPLFAGDRAAATWCSPRDRSRSIPRPASWSAGTIEAQAERVLENLRAVLEAAGSGHGPRAAHDRLRDRPVALRPSQCGVRRATSTRRRRRARRCRWPRCRSAR